MLRFICSALQYVAPDDVLFQPDWELPVADPPETIMKTATTTTLAPEAKQVHGTTAEAIIAHAGDACKHDPNAKGVYSFDPPLMLRCRESIPHRQGDWNLFSNGYMYNLVHMDLNKGEACLRFQEFHPRVPLSHFEIHLEEQPKA